MATKDRVKAKGRADEGSFMRLPHSVVSTRKYANLSGWAVRLLIDLFAQFRGKNNGDLCAAWSVMRERGWRSKGTLTDATAELLDAGIIIKTQQGGRHRPSLYGVSWLAIDECRDSRTKAHKLDHPPTNVAPGTWKDD